MGTGLNLDWFLVETTISAFIRSETYEGPSYYGNFLNLKSGLRIPTSLYNGGPGDHAHPIYWEIKVAYSKDIGQWVGQPETYIPAFGNGVLSYLSIDIGVLTVLW